MRLARRPAPQRAVAVDAHEGGDGRAPGCPHRKRRDGDAEAARRPASPESDFINGDTAILLLWWRLWFFA